MSEDQRMTEDASTNWHTLSSNQVLTQLNVAEHGLTSQEAQKRIETYGQNQLVEAPRPGFLSLLWDQLKDFVVMLLIVAAAISIALGEGIDAAAIIAIVVLNAILGIVQERRAEEALEALKKLAAPEAHVLRDGNRVTIPGRDLVPGDIVFLEAGNFVPADLRLLEAINLRIEEASLTGESLAVQKNATLILGSEAPIGDRKNSAFMGTTVAYGRGKGIVTSTGMNTQLGEIATMLQNVETEETPLQRRLNELGKSLSIIALILVALVFVVEVINETEILTLFSNPALYFSTETIAAITEAFLIAVSLAIAAVPEGLPAVVTISLALGMQEMVRKHALIRKLASVETLGSATIICSDKTGTLTQNAMTVTRIWSADTTIDVTGTGYSTRGEFQLNGKKIDLKQFPAILTTIWLGVLNNDAEINATGETQQIIGDPTEAALIVVAEKSGTPQAEIGKAYPRTNEIPFDSDRKRMITIHNVTAPRAEDPSPFNDNKNIDWDIIAVKGAPDIVLNLCKYVQMPDNTSALLDEKTRQNILKANDAMTEDALRVLGVAYRVVPETPAELDAERIEQDLVFVGLIGMIDPPRDEVKPALAIARNAGIRTMMITGDFPNTARAIAQSIGLLRPGKKIMTGAELDTTSDADLILAVQETDVFARVSPEHKMRIVDALQANDEVVAMTGDGVNDAPAIKRADIGVAMGITGTDVAKQTADMVLTDDNYASIVSAVAQGRIIYGNIRKFVFFLLSSNVAEIMIIFLATLAGFPPPLTAIQLLWLNLITDGAPALALAMEKGDPDIMEYKPRPKNEPIVNKTMLIGIIVQTVAQTSVVLTAFCVGLLWELAAHGHLPAAGQSTLNFLLNFDWKTIELEGLRTAETMAFITLSMAELFRAYTVRSERASLFTIGVFSNKWMQYAVGVSVTLLIIVSVVPFLQNIFNTHWMSPQEWITVFSLAILPAIAEESTKFFLHRAKA
jgi:Ca2+-transporting ATPase